jgi:hypothetical protein
MKSENKSELVAKSEIKRSESENFIYIIVIYSLDKNGDPTDMHNHGWFTDLADAVEYLELAGQPVPGAPPLHYYDDPFEQRWSYALIEKVPEGIYPNTEIVANYQAKWYLDKDYEYDHSVTELVNKFRQRKFKVVKLDKPPFDASQMYNFSGM